MIHHLHSAPNRGRSWQCRLGWNTTHNDRCYYRHMQERYPYGQPACQCSATVTPSSSFVSKLLTKFISSSLSSTYCHNHHNITSNLIIIAIVKMDIIIINRSLRMSSSVIFNNDDSLSWVKPVGVDSPVAKLCKGNTRLHIFGTARTEIEV